MAADNPDNISFKDTLMYKFTNKVEQKNGDTPLLAACKNGHLNIIITLVCHGADLDHRNFNNETAMDIAIKNNYQDIITFLTEITPELPIFQYLILNNDLNGFDQKYKEIDEKYSIPKPESIQ